MNIILIGKKMNIHVTAAAKIGPVYAETAIV
jgi:hypothetical protein